MLVLMLKALVNTFWSCRDGSSCVESVLCSEEVSCSRAQRSEFPCAESRTSNPELYQLSHCASLHTDLHLPSKVEKTIWEKMQVS